MRLAVLGAAVFAGALAAFVIYLTFSGDDDVPAEGVVAPAPTPSGGLAPPTATPIPDTWLGALGIDAEPLLLSCLDANGDGRLASSDSEEIPRGLDIPLNPERTCINEGASADFYTQPFGPKAALCGAPPPLLIVLVASACSDLLMPREGESLGLIDIANGLRARLDADGIASTLTVTTAALFGGDPPQTSMERFLAAHVRDRLDDLPCAHAVIVGHSHGGATVTSVTAALDDAYGDRLLGVLIDRTTVLYDRQAREMPSRTPLLNFFQLNEGWHGEPIDLPNVTNFDHSEARAPIAPSDGGGGDALVTHKTLDDAAVVQEQIIAQVGEWIAAKP